MSQEERWNELVKIAFRLSELRHLELPERIAHAHQILEKEALKTFPFGIEPLEDFEGYSVRRMLLAFRDALEWMEPESPEGQE